MLINIRYSKVFLAEDGQPLVVTGSGTLGWDMVGANLLEEGDEILIVNTGNVTHVSSSLCVVV